MSHTSRILQEMKEGCVYRAEDLDHLGIQRGTVSLILKHLTYGDLVELIEDKGYRKRKIYKTKQKDLFTAPPEALINDCTKGKS